MKKLISILSAAIMTALCITVVLAEEKNTEYRLNNAEYAEYVDSLYCKIPHNEEVVAMLNATSADTVYNIYFKEEKNAVAMISADGLSANGVEIEFGDENWAWFLPGDTFHMPRINWSLCYIKDGADHEGFYATHKDDINNFIEENNLKIHVDEERNCSNYIFFAFDEDNSLEEIITTSLMIYKEFGLSPIKQHILLISNGYIDDDYAATMTTTSLPIITTTTTTTVIPLPEPTEPVIIAGDVNGDNETDARDCSYIALKIAENAADELDVKVADFNKDNIVNIRDAATLARHLALK